MVEASITPAMARHIEIWPTDRLVPYAKNARTHSPEQVAQIAASIVEFGLNPILVDSTDGIIAGHGRLLAARKLGLAEVPVVVLGHLSETQRRAYIIADNQLALNAGWNDDCPGRWSRSVRMDSTCRWWGFPTTNSSRCWPATNRRRPPMSRRRFPNLPRSRLRCPGTCG